MPLLLGSPPLGAGAAGSVQFRKQFSQFTPRVTEPWGAVSHQLACRADSELAAALSAGEGQGGVEMGVGVPLRKRSLGKHGLRSVTGGGPEA